MPSLFQAPNPLQIHLSRDAPAPDQYAARQLAEHLTAAGISVEITSDAPITPHIRLGGACPAGFLSGLGEEAFRYRVTPQSIDIAGVGPRGTVYGVYAFLEEQLGCRWYASTLRRVPPSDGVLPEADVCSAPAFEGREVYWRDATDGDFALRLRLNSSRANIPPEHGGRLAFHRFSHTFDELIPVDRYFDEHPEYFSMVNGKRLRERTQLCLTNPQVLALAIEGMRGWIRENPEVRIFSVAQNDWYNGCTCPECSALDAAEGSAAGSLLHFINAIADAIVPDHPDVLLHTFAYIYTRRAPRHVRPHDHVIVRLCDIECCFSHPLDGCTHAIDAIDVQDGSASGAFEAASQSRFVRDLADWSAICKRLYIWDYTVNFANYLQPFPNLQVLQPNVRLFARYGVRGVFEQGNFSPGAASAFAGLKTYLLAKLLWDPDCDVATHQADYLAGVFGDGAPYVADCLALMADAVGPHHMSIYDMPDAPYLDDGMLAQADALLAKAEAATQHDDAARDRIALERLSVRYTQLARLPLDAPDRDALWDTFATDLHKFGITELFERKNLAASIARLKQSRYAYGREDIPYIDYKM